MLGTSESAGNYSEDVLKGALGFLLFIAQLAAFFQSGNGISEIVVNIILLAIPYYYLHNAYKNYKKALEINPFFRYTKRAVT